MTSAQGARARFRAALRIGAVLLSLYAPACSSEGTGSRGSSTGSVVGAWYGTGPDGDQCLVVCENGKLFTGDRPCTDVTAGDFASYLSYTAAGSTLTVSASSQCWFASSPCVQTPMTWDVEGNRATVAWCGAVLELNRTADSSSLCDDPARSAC